MSGVERWANAVHKDARVLLIVNSGPAAIGEVRGVLGALQATIASEQLSVIAPRLLCADFMRSGVPSRSVLPCDVDMGFFLQGPRALQWSLRQRADLVVGSEPYPPNNEQVKVEFERYLQPLLGHAQLLTHSLPSDQVFRFSLEDVWRRASRPASEAAHRARVEGTIDGLYRLWSTRPREELPSRARAALDAIEVLPPSDVTAETTPEAASWACRRLQDALLSDGGYPPPSIRVLTDPPGVAPPGGWLGGRIAHIGRPAHIGPGVRLHRARVVFHGPVEEPFSALLMSRYIELSAGDAVAAEGRLYGGGVTIGLVQDGNWTSRVDLVDPGRFVAAAVAPRPGKYALVIANCRPGADRRTAFALRRLGFQRLEK
jgi:hypothetical protein